MGRALDLARLLNSSGLVADAKIAALAANKLSGIIPDANAPSGSVIQIVQTIVAGTRSSNSTSLVDITDFAATITPTNAANKIFVQVRANNLSQGTQNIQVLSLRRNGATLPATANTDGGMSTSYSAFGAGGGGVASGNNNRMTDHASLDYLDSPGSTSAQTYKIMWMTTGGTAILNRWDLNADKGSVSTITLMEIAA